MKIFCLPGIGGMGSKCSLHIKGSKGDNFAIPYWNAFVCWSPSHFIYGTTVHCTRVKFRRHQTIIYHDQWKKRYVLFWRQIHIYKVPFSLPNPFGVLI